MRNNLEDLPFQPGKLFIVENYLEAVGVMSALRAGVSVAAVRRPLAFTNVREEAVRDKSERKLQPYEPPPGTRDDDQASVPKKISEGLK